MRVTEAADTDHLPPAQVMEQAAERERADWSAAIDLLVEANRIQRSDEIEIALASLRRRSYEHLREETTPEPQAALADPPPVGPSGLPEATISDLSSGAVRAAILGHGCVLVRGAVDTKRAAYLATSIDRAFAAQEAAHEDATQAEQGESVWFTRFPGAGPSRNWVRAGGGVFLGDSPRMLFDLLELYETIGLKRIAAEYLGSRPVLSLNKSTLRRVPLDATGGWHQDGAFLGEGIRALNIWLALTPCGVDAPGMDVVPRYFDHIVETGTEGAWFDWAVGDSVVEREAADVGIVRPNFDVGDLLLFDHMFLHRTAVEPDMTKERHAIEAWCFAAGAYPSHHVPFVW